jgi:hypothetical protein
MPSSMPSNGSRRDDKKKADRGLEEKHMLRWYHHLLVNMSVYTGICPFRLVDRRPAPV